MAVLLHRPPDLFSTTNRIKPRTFSRILSAQPIVGGLHMRHVSISAIVAVFTISFGQIAGAADPSVPVVAPFSWTGFYAGGNLGYGWGDHSANFSSFQLNSGIEPITMNDSYAVKVKGPVGGLQLGYNWQPIGNWVIGIETDIQASGQNGHSVSQSFILSTPGSLTAPTQFNPATSFEQSRIDWFGTVRGRLGYAWDRWLVYGTGGLAYGRISIGGVTTSSSFAGQNPPAAFTGTSTNTGWTAGGGIEVLLKPNWSAKVEYLYIDLGDVTGVGFVPPGGCYGTPGSGSCSGAVDGTGVVRATSSRMIDNVVRAGINYRFY